MAKTDICKPLYKHDCNDCIYLGSDETRDYYFCKKRSLSVEGSLIIRYSDKPSDYSSMPKDIVKRGLANNSLTEDTVFVTCYRNYLEYVENGHKTI